MPPGCSLRRRSPERCADHRPPVPSPARSVVHAGGGAHSLDGETGRAARRQYHRRRSHRALVAVPDLGRFGDVKLALVTDEVELDGGSAQRAAPPVPEPGQVVEARGSTWAVANVQAQGLPRSPADETAIGLNHVVRLQPKVRPEQDHSAHAGSGFAMVR